MAYGQALGNILSLGLTGKIIEAKISDVSAHAYAFDAGVLAQASRQWRLAAVLSNVGTKLKFLNQGDPLPANFRVAALYAPLTALNVTAEGVYRFTGLASFHSGLEWMPSRVISLRAGFRSDTLRHLSGFSGITTGVGLHLWGQEFDYAWVPLGDLGTTQYFSLLLRLGHSATPDGNLQPPPVADARALPLLTDPVLGSPL